MGRLQESFELIHILERAWRNPFTTKSNFAKEHASEVAAMASKGLISTKRSAHTTENLWKISPRGLRFLWDTKGIDA